MILSQIWAYYPLGKFQYALELKYALLLFLKSTLRLNLEELSENFENNYHINKLENSVHQVLRFHSKSFPSLLKLTLFL